MQEQLSRSEPKQAKPICMPSLYLTQSSSVSSAIAKHSQNTLGGFCINSWNNTGLHLVVIIFQQLKQSLNIVLTRKRMKISPNHTVTSTGTTKVQAKIWLSHSIWEKKSLSDDEPRLPLFPLSILCSLAQGQECSVWIKNWRVLFSQSQVISCHHGDEAVVTTVASLTK